MKSRSGNINREDVDSRVCSRGGGLGFVNLTGREIGLTGKLSGSSVISNVYKIT